MKDNIPDKKLFTHHCEIKVRFSDLDGFKHVNNANYLTYFEEARIQYMDMVIGTNVYWMKHGIILAKAVCNFRSPILQSDRVVVYTRCSRIGSKSFELEYLIERNTREGDVLIGGDGTTVNVCFDYEENGTMAINPKWVTAFKEYESSAPEMG